MSAAVTEKKDSRPKGHSRGEVTGADKKVIESRVPIVTPSNFSYIWPQLATAAMTEYGRAAQVMEEGIPYRIPEIVTADYLTPPLRLLKKGARKEADELYSTVEIEEENTLRQQLHTLEVSKKTAELQEATKNRSKEVAAMAANKTKLYAFIWAHLSTDSRESVRIQTEYDKINQEKDTNGLVAAIFKTHKTANAAYMDDEQAKYATRKSYTRIQQRDREELSAYYQRFKEYLQLYVNAGNGVPSEKDQVQDFMGSVDKRRYGEYVTNVQMAVAQGTRTAYPKDIVEAYRELIAYNISVVKQRPRYPRTSDTPSAFVTNAGRKGQRDDDSKAAKKEKRTTGSKDMAKIRCHGCHQYGHMLKDCPDASPGGGAAHHTSIAFVTKPMSGTGGVHHAHEVLLDNESNVSIVHPMLCSGLRALKRTTYVNIGSQRVTVKWEGYLEHFGWVWVSDELPANVLCMSDVEDRFKIEYKQRISFTVKLPNRDLVFKRRDKYYVADMSDWVDDEDLEEYAASYVVTVEQLEASLTKKQLAGLNAARRFIASAGFPSQLEAIHLLTDGNLDVTSLGCSVADIQRAFQIPNNPYSLKGKRTSKKVMRQDTNQVVVDIKQPQSLQSDVMHFLGRKFLVTHADPLKLLLSHEVSSEETEALSTGINAHIEVLTSHKRHVSDVKVEPTPAARRLVGKMGDTPVIPVGAREHLEKVDRGIRSIEEIARCTLSSLPYEKMPEFLTPDLVTFATVRKNSRRSTAKNNNIAPKVELTGRQLHRRDFIGGFGQYAEVYRGTTNTAATRTHSALMLYPLHNASGAWRLLDLETKKRITSSNFEVLPITEEVIARVAAMCRDSTEDEAEPAAAANAGTERTMEMPDGFVTLDDVADMTDSQPHGGATDEHVQEPIDNCEDATNTPDTATDEGGEQTAEQTAEQHDARLDEEIADDDPPVDETEDQGDRPRRSTQGVPAPRLEYPAEHIKPARKIGKRRTKAAFHVNKKSKHVTAKRGVKDFGDKAEEAMIAELEALLTKKKALSPVHLASLSRAQRKKVIRSFMFLKEKYKFGKLERIKARLVSNGKQQDKHLYPDKSSPTATLTAIFAMLAVAALTEEEVIALDIGTAYLNATMPKEDEVYIEVDAFVVAYLLKHRPDYKPFQNANGTMVFKVDRAIYGCIQSARLWYEHLRSVLEALHFKTNELDPCVFTRITGDSETRLSVAVYVDDLLICCKDKKQIEQFVSELKQEFGEIKCDMTEKKIRYLGMNIERTARGISIDMEDYVEDLLRFAPPTKGATRTVHTPASTSLYDVDITSEPLPKAESVRFHATVAKLLYLALRARPEIQTAVSFLTTRVDAPTLEDKYKLNRVLCYLQDNRDRGVFLPARGEMKITAYVDAAFGTHTDGKSHTGMVVVLGNALVAAKSTKQRIVSRNSTEAELIALSDRIDDVLWIYDFVKSLGYELPPPTVYEDNASTLHMVTEGGGQSSTRHLRARQYYIKEKNDNQVIKVQYMCTIAMLADLLTKPVGNARFRELARSITHSGPRLSAH